MKKFRLVLVFGFLAAVLWANVAKAFSITEVTLLPAAQITPSDQLQMAFQIATPGQPAFLDAPTQVSSNANGIHVDIFPDSGTLAVIGSLYESVTLGTFPPGTLSTALTTRNKSSYWSATVNEQLSGKPSDRMKNLVGSPENLAVRHGFEP